MVQELLIGLVALFAAQTVTTTCGWGVLRGTVGRPRTRLAGLAAVLVAYHVALFAIVTKQQVLLLGVGFVLYHLGFTCRWLSATWYHRRAEETPEAWFFHFMMVLAARQNYGGGGWDRVELHRFDRRLLRSYGSHVAYSVSVILAALVAIVIILQAQGIPVPWRRFLFAVAAFVGSVEGLALWGNTHSILLSFFGLHYKFFGNYTWLRSRHIGEFWRNWNVHAILFFQEISAALRLRRRFFLNTVAVFAVSGILHQVTIWYYTRSFGILTTISFLIHGFAVYVFSRAFRRSRDWPAPVRWLVFNPLTCVIVTAVASYPFILEIMSAADPVAR